MHKAHGWDMDGLKRNLDWSGKTFSRLVYGRGTWEDWFLFMNKLAAML